jgi:crotonobetainyl-CoA:carnitine CoA-transferase CaiB-like acyl-CoA transferase
MHAADGVGGARSRAGGRGSPVSDFAGSNNFHGVPYGAFPAADGAVNIGCNRDEFWRRLCVAMGRPELGTDPRYATYATECSASTKCTPSPKNSPARIPARDQAKLAEVDVPVAGILSMEEVMADDYLQKRRARCARWTTVSAAPSPCPRTRPGRADDPYSARPSPGRTTRCRPHTRAGAERSDIARLERTGAFGAVAGADGKAASSTGAD